MINRKHIESILRINGASPSSPDETIRSVLFSARYNKDEVDTAIMVLREDVKTKKTRVEGLHKIFRTDEALKPKEISQLLGIDIDISDVMQPKVKQRRMSASQMIFVPVFSLLFAFIGVVLLMYFYSIGPFHDGVSTASGVASYSL